MIDAALACPPAIVEMSPEARSRYESNSNGSVVDAKRAANYNQAVAPVRAARADIAKMANRYTESQQQADATATGDCLENWVKEEALTHFFNRGTSEADQANHAIQQFNLSLTLPAVAMSYAQVKHALPPAQRKRIEHWLQQVDATLENYNNPKKLAHNHTYWIGAAHASVGYATGNKALFEKGYALVKLGVDAIDDELMFPAETQRGAFSLGYQFFAMMPILLVAEQGLTLGKNLYAERDGILGKVVKERLTPALMGDRATLEILEQRSGETQLPVKFVNLPTLALYYQRFPDVQIEQAVNTHIQFLAENQQPDTAPVKLTKARKLPTLHDLFAPECGGKVNLLYTFMK